VFLIRDEHEIALATQARVSKYRRMILILTDIRVMIIDELQIFLVLSDALIFTGILGKKPTLAA